MLLAVTAALSTRPRAVCESVLEWSGRRRFGRRTVRLHPFDSPSLRHSQRSLLDQSTGRIRSPRLRQRRHVLDGRRTGHLAALAAPHPIAHSPLWNDRCHHRAGSPTDALTLAIPDSRRWKLRLRASAGDRVRRCSAEGSSGRPRVSRRTGSNYESLRVEQGERRPVSVGSFPGRALTTKIHLAADQRCRPTRPR